MNDRNENFLDCLGNGSDIYSCEAENCEIEEVEDGNC